MVPFLDLKAQVSSIEGEVREALLKVLGSTQFVLGSEVESFERRFAEYCGAGEAIAVNSGTSALHLALLAAGIGPGDEVITTPMTFVATVAPILYAGATPVFVDADPESRNIDVSRIAEAVTPKTKAVMPVHLHGLMADMDPILDVAREHGLTVIEDAAQAHGAAYKGRGAGTMGQIGCFSFYPGKNLGAYGEGGAIVTSDPELAKTMRMLRDWGQARKYEHVLKGYNYRMDGFQGAVLGVKMNYIEDWTESRRRNAAAYEARLGPMDGVVTPGDPGPDYRHVYHVFSVEVDNRDAVQRSLNEQGIQTGIHYPTPVHLQPAYADPRYGVGAFPVAESLGNRFLSLPMYPEMTEAQVGEVCRAMEIALAGNG